MGHGNSGRGSKYAEGSRAVQGIAPNPLADSATVNLFQQGFEQWAQGLTQEERSIIKGYTVSDYLDMNRAIRAGDGSPEMQHRVEVMQKALLRAQMPEAATVFRGISGTMDPANARKMIGKVVVNEGFSSTSLNFHTGYTFTGRYKGNTVYQFNLPKGSNAAYMRGSREKEILLPKGAKFRITGVRTFTYRGAYGGSDPVQVTLIQADYLGA